MCNTNCCKKEEDLICAMPIPFCGCDGCCPIPCGGCFKDDGCCGCCCDCDDSCCYCKYYKLLKELRDRLENDENRITNLESSDTRINNKIDNMYQDLMNQLVEIAGNLEHEVCERHDDVDNELNRAQQAESDLYQYIHSVDIREADHHAAQAAEIQRLVNYLLDNADPAKIDSFREMLDWVNNLDTTIFDRIAAEETARTNADNGIKDRLTALETLTGTLTINRGATLVPGSSVEIALVNNKSITVGLPDYPSELKNPYKLKFTGHSGVQYDGSSEESVHIPDDTADLHTNTEGYINALGVGSGAHANDIYYKKGKDNVNYYYITVPYATKASQDANGNNIASTYLTKAEGVTAVGIDSSNRITYTINGQSTPISTPYLTSHQSIKSLNTNNSSAQSASSSEAIAGSGTINLHKISKTGSYSDLIGAPSLAAVATSGSYADLTNKPAIPSSQVNSDWNAVSGISLILNKPSLATVATSGSYADLSNKPTIPSISANIDGTTYTTLQGIVDAILAKILWELDSDGKVIAKSSRAAKAAGFYDTTVS